MAEADPSGSGGQRDVEGLCAASTGQTLIIDGSTYTHPIEVTEWADNAKDWPEISSAHIVCYLLRSQACDLKEAEAFKSLESYNYLQSGWVGQVLSHKVNEELVYLKAEVRPSQAVNNKPWTAWACVRQTGEVITGACSCMAGQAGVCSHVGAVLWKVEMGVKLGLTGSTCTDQAALWNRGTKRNVEPALLKDIKFKMKKATVDEDIKKPRPTRRILQFETDEELTEHISKSPYPGLFSIPGTLLHSTLNAVHCSGPADRPPSDEPRHVHSDNQLPSSCNHCKPFYEEFVVLSPKGRAALEVATKDQSCTLWNVARRLRITASNVKRVPKRENTNPLNAVLALASPSFMGNSATKYGLKCEAIARAAFSKKTGLSVLQSGMLVSTAHPWLSASPDGICGDGALLEIKCPIVTDCKSLLEGGKYDVRYLDGEAVLCPNGKNGYYSQVQFTLFCSEKTSCHFYVWSPESDVLVNVSYNPEYVRQHINRLKNFYFQHLLPYVEEQHSKGQLLLGKKYCDICNM